MQVDDMKSYRRDLPGFLKAPKFTPKIIQTKEERVN